ncbi:MAG: DUF4199 domain-containing protein, partial [Cyclobacteriaceae bacterium]
SEEYSNSMIKEAIKYGAIFAVVSFIIQLVLYAIDYTLLVATFYQILSLLVIMIALVMVGIKFRKQQGGFLSFGSAYGFLMMVTVSFFLIGIVFSLLFYNVIDPELPELLQEIQIERTIETLESFNASDEQIDQAVSEAEGQNLNNISVLLQGTLILSLIFAVINLVLALIVKKSRPDFE